MKLELRGCPMDLVELAWKNRVLIRWVCSRWCNYACSYCPQEHQRKQIFRGSPGHWTDNYPVEKWLEAFNAIPELTLYITGGEPMLDRRSMQPFLEGIRTPYVKIDTNCSWNPRNWSPPNKDFMLLTSFHPEQTTVQKFFDNLYEIKVAGWNIIVVNVVARPGHFDELEAIERRCEALCVPFSLLPKDGVLDGYSDEEKAELRGRIPEPYREMRVGANPKGKLCLHPSVAYKVWPDGSLEVGCHPDMVGSVFDGLPERFDGYTACPFEHCFCTEKYSFLKSIGTNVGPVPHVQFLDALKEVKHAALQQRD